MGGIFRLLVDEFRYEERERQTRIQARACVSRETTVIVLRYHSRTFQLLGIEPRRSSSAIEALARVENKIGRTLSYCFSAEVAVQDCIGHVLSGRQNTW